MFSVSATTPWPAKDASPWMRIGSATRGSCTPARVGRSVGAALRAQAERLLGARHNHVEPFCGELVLAEEHPAEVALEAVDLGEPLEQLRLLRRGGRLAVLAGLDRLAEPDAPLVVGDVLD